MCTLSSALVDSLWSPFLREGPVRDTVSALEREKFLGTILVVKELSIENAIQRSGRHS